MARGDQLARQWKILQKLHASRYGKSAADLSEDIDCHPRTVYRDLDALVEAGFPIYTEKVQGKNLWSLLDTMKHHLPVPFTLPEIMALHFSRNMLHIFKNTMFHDSLESLFEKVKITLPPESHKYLEKAEQTLKVSFKPYKAYEQYKEIVNQVNEAAMASKTVEIIYYTMSRKKESRRRVDPYRIWFFNGSFYLIGYCHKRREVRIFAISRIRMLHQTGEVFEISENFNADDFIKPSFGVYQGKSEKVRIWFSPKVAGYIQEQTWHESQKIEALDDGAIVFEAEVAGIEEIKHWVMSWGSSARVLDPEILQDEIRSEALAMLGESGDEGRKSRSY